MTTVVQAQPPAGWRRKVWCASVGISRSTFYALPTNLKPAMMKIGKSLFIVESPAAWLERAHRQGPERLTDPEYVRGRHTAQPGPGAA